jgi:tRNA U34 5-methylaminomethyl-2-thiouridine-forming methyltransferase MnmC
MKLEIRETLDGSHTVYEKEMDEHYHSTFGAIRESQHVFIKEGFGHCPAREIRVLEIGFGTGLNCYLTLVDNLKKDIEVSYYSVEKNPLPEEVWEKLNYSANFQDNESDFFWQLHNAPWNSDVRINSHFLLHKINGDALALNFIDLPKVDVVYFDAFSPEKQPELWERSLFEALFSKMNDHGIFVTYCAKGSVRRILQSVGFEVERIPGPPGKREMIRARKTEHGERSMENGERTD